MAAPTISYQYNIGSDAAPSWTTIAGGEVITFTGSGSSDGDLKPIPVPTGSNLIKLGVELWINKATDAEIALWKDGSEGQTHDSYTTDFFTVNPTITNTFAVLVATNPETQAGEMEAWDDTGYSTTAKEILNGTANLGVHSQLRMCFTASNVAVGAGAGTMPAPYQAQGGQTTTYQLQGSTRSQTAGSACTAGNQNRFTLHLFIVDDSAAGAETVELTYKYFYT